MGGKAMRRREKNYRAAHGSGSRLPPPPDPSQLDVLPSKLRTLLSFTSSTNNNGPTDLPKATEQKRKRDGDIQKKGLPAEYLNEDEAGDMVEEKKKRKKRKSKQVDDLRFETLVEKPGDRKRDRKKRYLEEKKKKKKQKKSETEEKLDFPGREQIKFGDVVQAPPKLLALPKKLTNVQDASRERLRLQAIDAYRNRKGWTSRPGLQLPGPVTTTPLL